MRGSYYRSWRFMVYAFIHRTCRTFGPNGRSHVLGVDFGTDEAATSQFDQRILDCVDLHRGINNMGDAGTELVLVRKCANACKITNLLRATGPSISTDSLHQFDSALDGVVSRSLGGDLHEATQHIQSMDCID